MYKDANPPVFCGRLPFFSFHLPSPRFASKSPDFPFIKKKKKKKTRITDIMEIVTKGTINTSPANYSPFFIIKVSWIWSL